MAKDAETKVREYERLLDMTAQELRLMCGEISTKEVRLIQAVLRAIRSKVDPPVENVS